MKIAWAKRIRQGSVSSLQCLSETWTIMLALASGQQQTAQASVNNINPVAVWLYAWRL